MHDLQIYHLHSASAQICVKKDEWHNKQATYQTEIN